MPKSLRCLRDMAERDDGGRGKRARQDVGDASHGGGGDGIEIRDARSLRRVLAGVQKKVKENLELRLKYPDQPERFMDSEVDLDQELQRLQSLATVAWLYPEFIRLDGIPMLLGLLGSHENASITKDVVFVLSELLDADAAEDRPDEAAMLAGALLDGGVLALVVDVLYRSDETVTEEAESVYHALSLLENMLELKPAVAERLVAGASDQKPIQGWLLRRVGAPEHDSNRLYASEILTILLQGSDENKRVLSGPGCNGVEAVLQAIARFRKVDPAKGEEEEFLENLFDALCAFAMAPEAKRALLDGEALALMILMMKKRKAARAPAMKVVSFAVADSVRMCEHLVDARGLGPLFGLFMGKGLDYSKQKKRERAKVLTEHVLSILASALQQLKAGARRDRILSKFVEGDYEKCDRLVELWEDYHGRVSAAIDAGVATDATDAGDAEEQYLDLLDQGLYVLQQIAVILAHCWASGIAGVQKRLVFVLRQHSHGLEDVCHVLKRKYRFMFEVDDGEVTKATNAASGGGDESQKTQLMKLIQCTTVQ